MKRTVSTKALFRDIRLSTAAMQLHLFREQTHMQYPFLVAAVGFSFTNAVALELNHIYVSHDSSSSYSVYNSVFIFFDGVILFYFV